MRNVKSRFYGNGGDHRRIYLVAPRHPRSFWSMQGTVDLMGAKTLMPNSALATLMALTPQDVNVEYVLCDENVSEVDFNMPCDLVAVTGATLHSDRIKELCAGFRSRGIPVALGGTYSSINPELCKGFADYQFIGEAEYTWPEFLRHWKNDHPLPLYIQKTYVNMKDSPAPDWSLIKIGDYLNMSIQTSRGCPNRCDFCDVIQYVGNKYRTKSHEQIIREIRNAHALGARTVFFSDDNFLGNKRFTRELLRHIIEWNKLQSRPLSFSTQITLQAGDDDGLCRMFADARFSVLFLGVETVREASLKEVKKYHNMTRDMRERINRISKHGIVPFLGLIVGFDHDDISVFDELYDLIDDTGSPIAGVSLLNAPRNTPLYKRLEKQGRLIGDDFSGEWQFHTNIIPKQMDRELMLKNYRELYRRIYDPASFNRRINKWLKQVNYFSDLYDNRKFDVKQISNMLKIVMFLIFRADPALRSVFIKNIIETWKINPALMKRAFTLLAQYRHFYDFMMDME